MSFLQIQVLQFNRQLLGKRIGYLRIIECKELDWIPNAALRFLIAWHYLLHNPHIPSIFKKTRYKTRFNF